MLYERRPQGFDRFFSQRVQTTVASNANTVVSTASLVTVICIVYVIRLKSNARTTREEGESQLSCLNHAAQHVAARVHHSVRQTRRSANAQAHALFTRTPARTIHASSATRLHLTRQPVQGPRRREKRTEGDARRRGTWRCEHKTQEERRG